MPNKYNIRAKRLALDNMIRERSWGSFQNTFSQLSVPNHGKPVEAGKEGDIKHHPKGGTTNLCQSIVQCRNHHTTHRTLLHSLCDIPSNLSPPPSELIHMVASSCPRALMLHESGNETTPLHLAIAQRAPMKTIQALMEAADIDDSLNLKRQDLLLALDSKGQTPLLLAVRGGDVDDDVVKYLANQDNIDGSSLLISGLRKKKQKNNNAGAPLKYVASNESIFVGEGLENPEDLLRFMIVRTYHAKLKKRFPKFYDSVAHGDTMDQIHSTTIDNIDNDTCPLQAAIFCHELFGSSKVASSILSYIIRNELFHRDRLDSQRDNAGNLTLHVACLSDTRKFDQILRLGERVSDYGLNSDDCTLMEYLIKASPSPCTVPYLSRNADGELPLHCAINSGKDWSQIQLLIDACPSSVKFRTTEGELPIHLAIKCGNPTADVMKLWNYYPESASIADKSTGLYPFQSAAVYGKKQHRGKCKIKKKTLRIEGVQPDGVWDATSLSFFLLRECPSLLSTSLVRTP